MKEVKLARGICTTYYAKLVQFIKRLPDEDQREYEKSGNFYSGVLYSLIAIITNSMNNDLMLKNMCKIKNILSISYPSRMTLRSYLSHLKKCIINKFSGFPEIVKAAKETFCLSKADYDELEKNYNKLVIERNKNQETLSDLLIIKIVHETMQSLLWEENMIAIALACGSRMIEIAKISSYERVGGEPFQLVIHGVAKSKERKVSIKKPVVAGLRASQVIQMIPWVRSRILLDFEGNEWGLLELKDIENSALTRFIAGRVEKYVKQHLGPFITGKLSFHTLRSIYAEMAWVESEGTHTMSKTAYYADVLGHKPTDINTALSYQRFVVKPGLEIKEVKKPVTYADNVLKVKKNKKKANFKGKNGWFSIEKKTNGKRMECLVEDAKVLKENGIKLTFDNLRRCGYGSMLIKKFKTLQKSGGVQLEQTLLA